MLTVFPRESLRLIKKSLLSNCCQKIKVNAGFTRWYEVMLRGSVNILQGFVNIHYMYLILQRKRNGFQEMVS